MESGQWLGLFTGTTVTEASKLDVDHMVPLANAHNSGAWNWDADRRKAYANNLEDFYHLIAVTVSSTKTSTRASWQSLSASIQCLQSPLSYWGNPSGISRTRSCTAPVDATEAVLGATDAG